eukprot:3991164-Karenia_brevis.AAC.1
MMNVLMLGLDDDVCANHADDDTTAGVVVGDAIGKLKSFSQYDSAKSTVHKMHKLGIWDEFTSFCGSHVDFLNPNISADVILANLHQIMVVLTSNFQGYRDSNDLACVAMEIIKFCLPLVKSKSGDDPTHHEVPWIFEKSSAANIEKILWVLTKMSDSKVFMTTSKPATAKKAAKSKAKSKAKAKAKGPAAPPPKDVAPESFNPEVNVDGLASRPSYWLDDMLDAINYAYSKLADPNPSSKPHIFRKLVNICLEFCFVGIVSVNGKQFNQWSKLRG